MTVFFEKVNAQFQQEKPFVLYCKPNSDSIIGMFQEDDTLYEIVDFTESGFVFASFDGKTKYLIPKEHSEIKHFPLNKKDISENGNGFVFSNESDKQEFEALVTKGITAITNGIFEKVVLSRKETIALSTFDFFATFEKLVNFYPTSFTYCFFHPNAGTWLGATPEQLLKVDAGEFKTIALAGTQKSDGSDEVIWQDKEKNEQQLVTDYIVSELNKVSKSISVSKPYSIKAGSIWHIKTDIFGQLNSTRNLKEVIDLLHPTPAVCGLPKQASQKFILENENYNRTFYTGFLGEINSDVSTAAICSDLFVNLRSMKIEIEKEKAIATLFMGCGITKDSIPEKEWEESVNKSMTMKRVLSE